MKPKSKPEVSELRERAMRLLARREHSRAELVRKLGQSGFDECDIQPLLDEFEEKRWLSDRRFAESWVADHRSKAGSVKLAHELRQRGVSEAIIDDVLNDSRDSEVERARLVWQKKFGVAPTDIADKAKQMRFLQGRGFAPEVIWRVIGKAGDA
jgi:regulatory protein